MSSVYYAESGKKKAESNQIGRCCGTHKMHQSRGGRAVRAYLLGQRAETDGSDARWSAEDLLAAGVNDVDAPGVREKRLGAQRGDRVHD